MDLHPPKGQTTPRSASDRGSSIWRRSADQRRLWWSATGLLLLVQLAWALSTPLMTGPDEADHAIRAAAVARGQVAGEPAPSLLGANNIFVVVRVPETYGRAATAGSCFIGRSRTGSIGVPGARVCTPIGSGTAQVSAKTLQYRGQPLYYALIGWVSRIDTGPGGMRTMRLLTAALTAMLCASALCSATRFRARRLGALAVGLTWTPVLLYLGGSINTTAPEAAAAICLWASGAALVREARAQPRLLVRTAVAAILVMATRGLGPIFCAAILGTLALLAEPGARRSLMRSRPAWAAALGLAIVGVLTATWLLWVQRTLPLDARAGVGLVDAASELGYLAKQTVGVFGVNDIELPGWVALAWAVPIGAVLVAGWRRADRWRRWLPSAVLGGAIALTCSAEGLSIPPIGYSWQGRYVLPLLVGVPILAAAAADRDLEVDISSLKAWSVLPIAVHIGAYAVTMRHFTTVGLENPGLLAAFTDPTWEPLGPPFAIWLLLYAVAITGVAALVLNVPERA